MRTLYHTPHPLFGVIWAFTYINVWISCVRVFWTDGWWWGVGTLVAIFYFEWLALKLNWRWTMSAVMTWIVRRMSKHDRAFTGWNNIIWLGAFPISALVFLLCHVLIGGNWSIGVVIGLAIALPLLKGLHDHWLHPDLHG